MKTTIALALRTVSIAATLFVGPITVSARSSTNTDRAAELLQRTGVIAVSNAGPYVEEGTFRVQVAAKLGRPDLKLADGTWLYHERRVGNSNAKGTLVVRFTGGRVSSLALVTPAVATALRADPRKPLASERLATK